MLFFRHPECKKLKYVAQLPTASVIICYYHEELLTLLRTIHSVLDRSPKPNLREIIVVDDKSDFDIKEDLVKHLEDHQLTDLVKVYTPPERLGLIRARMFGARKASGDVLVSDH